MLAQTTGIYYNKFNAQQEEREETVMAIEWAYRIILTGLCGLAAVILLWYLFAAWGYRRTAYYEVTRRSFGRMRFDIGNYGEYLTYRKLRKYEKRGARFLFNCYIPKNEKETTEIDLLMIYDSGIYVFESKNYGGWIFGGENWRMWTQSFPGSGEEKKRKFYNPIMQNASHMRGVQRLVRKDIPLHSVIVFSERCTFKKMEIESKDIKVCKRDAVASVVRKLNRRTKEILSENEIDEIYDKLYPYTQVGRDVRKKHIRDVKKTVRRNRRRNR